MKISDWINDLCWYYMHKRRALDKESESEYKGLIQAQKQKIYELPPSPYRDGLLKAIEELE